MIPIIPTMSCPIENKNPLKFFIAVSVSPVKAAAIALLSIINLFIILAINGAKVLVIKDFPTPSENFLNDSETCFIK